jgi:anti-sigma factor RsiW
MHPGRQPAHPDEQKLLLLLDGELTLRDARPIRKHLERCRACRAKVRTMQAGLCALAEYGRADLLPPKGWSEFRALLDRA